MFKRNKFLCMLISLVILFDMCVFACSAESAEEHTEVIIASLDNKIDTSDIELPSNDELFERFAENVFYGSGTPEETVRKRSVLNDIQQIIYKCLIKDVKAITSGESENTGSTDFYISAGQLGVTGMMWTPEVLNLPYFIKDDEITEDTVFAVTYGMYNQSVYSSFVQH